ncbi:hypothetical protein OIE52_50750 [Streptomyces canus]|uniref:hypothetical protein n=1 Tax=Streptomyces canus TaxID=58343 RepID=UPI0030E31D67
MLRFYVHVADHAHLPELATLAETIEQWQDGILAYVETGTTKPRDQARGPQCLWLPQPRTPTPPLTLRNDRRIRSILKPH